MCAQTADSSSEAELRATMAEYRSAALEGDLDKIAGCLAGQYLQTYRRVRSRQHRLAK